MGCGGNHYRRLLVDEQSKVKRVHLGMNPGRDVTVVSESGPMIGSWVWLSSSFAPPNGGASGADFYSCVSKTKGRPRKDYLLTLDMAKELSMVERTDVGRGKQPFSIRPHSRGWEHS